MISKGTPYLGNGRNNDSSSEFIKCRKCGHEYYKTWNHCPECRTPKGQAPVRPIFLIILTGVIAIALFYFSSSSSDDPLMDSYESDSEFNSTNNMPEESVDSFNSTPVDSPTTGIYQLFTNSELLSPFETRNHTDNKCYLLKFVNTVDNTVSFTIFLNKQENCNVKVPLGSYIIMAASGETWYGDQELFGPSTSFVKYSNTYNFYISESGYNGWYVDFTNTPDGNLKYSYITEDEFQ